MLTLNECEKIINRAIDEMDLPASPAKLYDPIQYVLQLGGKRIRPILVLMACNLYIEDISQAVYPALALELFHNFTLLHDDIMDKAVLRRNQPTVHVKWNENVGILSGDAMLIKAYELLSRTSPAYILPLLSLFNTTAMQVCEGQQYDMDYEEKDEISMSEYLKMIELKTAVLLGASLKTGAIIGDADEKNAALLYEFGRNLGIAFQLQDDLLDLYADPVKFGKDMGNDIVCNKKTILLVQAMQLASGTARDKLREWLKKESFNRNEKIRSVKAIFDGLQLRDKTQEKIRLYYEKAIHCLEDVPVGSGSKKELLRVAGLLLNRNR